MKYSDDFRNKSTYTKNNQFQMQIPTAKRIEESNYADKNITT